MDRFARYFIDAILVGGDSERWDLIVGYVPVIDEMMHSMLLVDPRQARWSAERERAFAEARLHVWRAVDGEVARLLAHVDLRTTSVFLVSDHGLRPLRAAFYPNVVLERAGLLRRDADHRVDTATSRALVLTTAAVGHVYLNLAGREPDGIVAPTEARALLARIRDLLTNVTVDGERPLRAVLTREETARLGMDNPNGGDLVLMAAPGWTLKGDEPSPGTARGDGLAAGDDGGQHGYLESEEPAMDAVFLALGSDIAQRTLPPLRNLEVAPRVARAIGIEPPRCAAPGTASPP
jgi:predicted AlkP superfamily phosphohydrolase/phosphomutase